MTGRRLRLSPGARLTALGVVVSFGFALLFQWPGVLLSADYWEGSISLLEGKGYRLLSGEAIVAWPPGFSAYLALWQLVLGVSAGTLAIAHSVAIGIAAGLWIAMTLRLAPRGEIGLRGLAVAIVLVFTIPLALRLVLSESLFMVWLGGALLVAIGGGQNEGAGSTDRGREARRLLLFGALLAALLLTRHAGVAYLPALALLYWQFGAGAPARARGLALLAAGGAVGLWIASRAILGQFGNNPTISLDASAVPLITESLTVNFAALWGLILPSSPAGVLLVAGAVPAAYLVLRLAGRPLESPTPPVRPGRGLGIAALLAGVCAALMWAFYGVSGGRIVLPMAALLVVLLGSWSWRAKTLLRRRLATALLVVIAAVQLARAAYWIHHASTVGPVGLDWRLKLVAACEPVGDCRLGTGEISPPELRAMSGSSARRTR